MKPEGNRERDSDNNITQLFQLLRKILGSQFKGGSGLPDLFSSQPKNQGNPGINLNICFFPFFPMTPEEMDELEAMYEDLEGSADDSEEDLSNELTSSDFDFLRRHGIKF